MLLATGARDLKFGRFHSFKITDCDEIEAGDLAYDLKWFCHWHIFCI